MLFDSSLAVILFASLTMLTISPVVLFGYLVVLLLALIIVTGGEETV
ncbi:MAG: hypothetical protein ACTSW4_07870 [Candidatus Ranarchaeia archaeon]